MFRFIFFNINIFNIAKIYFGWANVLDFYNWNTIFPKINTFESISWALKETASPLMGYLESEGSDLVFRFLPGGDPTQWHFSEELITSVSAMGGQIACKDLDDAFGICMRIPLGGETCG